MAREKTAAALSGILKSFGEETAEDVGAVLAPFRDGEGGLPDLAELQALLDRRLQRLQEGLVRADEKHLEEIEKDRALRKQRNTAARELASRISRLRYVMDQSCGPGTCEKVLDVKGPLPKDPVALRRIGQRMMHHLTSESLRMPPSSIPGVALDPTAWITFVEEPFLPLEDALERLPEEKAATANAKVAKDELLDNFDRAYLFTARLVEDLFRYVGRGGMAKAVRPSRRRKSSPQEEDPTPNNPEVMPSSTLPSEVLSKTVS